MNNKIFLKIGWLLIISLLGYLFFVVFFLSPKVNNYFSNAEIKKERLQFNKIVTIINNKSRNYVNKDSLIKDVELLLSSITLAKTGQIYIFDSSGKIIIDTSSEFDSKYISKLILPHSKNKTFFEEIKKSYNSKTTFEYLWNKPYDAYNYAYPKISWVEYNKDLDWYIVSSIYKEDFSTYVEGINSLILNISILLFVLLVIIGLVITIKVVAPINRMFSEVQKAQIKHSNVDMIKESKDEIGFLANQFNTLLDQVETNRKTLDDHVQKKTKEISDKLYYDELTNLKNRYALQEDIKDCEFVSIALVDIDSFDDINELYGFSTGNLVLIETANILNEFGNKYNVSINRIHGNVFSVTDKRMMGFSKYDQFISELSTLFKSRPILIEELDIEIFIDVTLGISIAQEEPLKTAGIALKRAKKTNHRYFVYNNELDRREIIERSIFWREKIKRALKDSNVIAFYQPIFNTKKEIVKYETLMRIKDIDKDGKVSYILPNLFLDVAIKTKQYLQLSNQVISKALSDLNKTKKQISFNLSFKDILDIDFVESLDKNLDNISNINKERIVFEILESDHITDYTILEDFINKYRRQGIKIAIDDFGTGYSNFAHILKIRPDYIKIDGSLIKDINTDKNSYEMVKSIIDFSKALNIIVIAEYVHSQEVFDLARQMGVDEFQGFYLGKPNPLIE